MFNGGSSFAIPMGASQFRFQAYKAARAGGIAESLGSRMIEGVETIGRRVTTVVSAGHHDNSIPAEIVDERWVSPDLRLVIYARTSDPVTGVFEYWLTNITRREPSPDLFVVPPDYTFDHCSLPEDPCFASEWLPQAK